MSNVKPPLVPAGTPVLQVVPAGTRLVRVHQVIHGATTFNPIPAHKYYGGGRFDGTDDDVFSYAYAATSYEGAISEALLRDLPIDHDGPRVLEEGRIIDRRATTLRTSCDLNVLSLRTGTHLGAVSQDTWLTWCDPRDYPQTRHWGHWIRGHVADAQGFSWISKREPSAIAYVLFGDRCAANTLEIDPHPPPDHPSTTTGDFADPVGRDWLVVTLDAYGVELDPIP